MFTSKLKLVLLGRQRVPYFTKSRSALLLGVRKLIHVAVTLELQSGFLGFHAQTHSVSASEVGMSRTVEERFIHTQTQIHKHK